MSRSWMTISRRLPQMMGSVLLPWLASVSQSFLSPLLQFQTTFIAINTIDVEKFFRILLTGLVISISDIILNIVLVNNQYSLPYLQCALCASTVGCLCSILRCRLSSETIFLKAISLSDTIPGRDGTDRAYKQD